MADPTVAELQTRIAELEQSEKTNVRDLMSHKKGYKKLADFLSAKGFDPESDLEEQWTKTQGKNKTDTEQRDNEMKKLQTQLDKLTKANEELATEKTNSTIKSKLQKTFEDVIGGEDLIDLWIATKRVKLDGDRVLKVEGADEIPLDTFAAKFKKDNPDRIKVKQQGGGGSSNGGEHKDNEPAKMKKGEYNKLAQTAKKDFLDKGGEILPD
jgi:hypothetical protein